MTGTTESLFSLYLPQGRGGWWIQLISHTRKRCHNKEDLTTATSWTQEQAGTQRDKGGQTRDVIKLNNLLDTRGSRDWRRREFGRQMYLWDKKRGSGGKAAQQIWMLMDAMARTRGSWGAAVGHRRHCQGTRESIHLCWGANCEAALPFFYAVK